MPYVFIILMIPIIDLNYRFDLPDIDIRDLIGSEDWVSKYEHLQKNDQVSPSLPPMSIIYTLLVACQGTDRWEGL